MKELGSEEELDVMEEEDEEEEDEFFLVRTIPSATPAPTNPSRPTAPRIICAFIVSATKAMAIQRDGLAIHLGRLLLRVADFSNHALFCGMVLEGYSRPVILTCESVALSG